MTARIILRDGVLRQAVSNKIRYEINDVNLEECVSVLRAKAAPLLHLKAEEIGSCILNSRQSWSEVRPIIPTRRWCGVTINHGCL